MEEDKNILKGKDSHDDRRDRRDHDEPLPYNRPFEQERENAEIERSKWRSRRKMAWVSLIAIIVITILCMYTVPIEKMKVIEEMISWFFIAMASVIGAYMGFTTWSSISKR